ncbi:carbohydrate ABC transporter permease [Streptomyces sp. NBC_01198]|uniref:carbohydrate ABC transporter permease n=1 Tax=Streptomyces sp. NBC_01198 TaxID=2903769 RepID=UPI002E125168|nr:carbohydrate ABC transporter permease [Streptomyces sp. NBC_01198]
MAEFSSQNRTLISSATLARPRGRFIYWTVLSVVLVVFTVVFVGPLYWMATSGFKSVHEVLHNPPTLIPKDPHPSNYKTAWTQLKLAKLLWNTFYYAFGALAFQLVFDVAAAYALSKLRPVMGNIVLGGMLATLMIPSAVLIIPQYMTVLDLPLLHVNLINHPWAIWLPTVANGFNIFLLKRFFDSIPNDLMAAAAIDGAGPMRTLLSIVLPMSRPILGVVSIFAVVNVWKDFLWPMLVEPDPEKQPINIGINSLSQGVPQNVLIAALAISALPTLLIFLLFQRNIMSGLTAGSLKG